MISGANDKELTIAHARADIILKLDNTATYESWLVIDTYIEHLEKVINEFEKWLDKKNKIELDESSSYTTFKKSSVYVDDVLSKLKELKSKGV